jgi:PAS domain S-box-containing protein
MEEKRNTIIPGQDLSGVGAYQGPSGWLSRKSSSERAEDSALPAGDLVKPRILIVEDGMIMAEDMRRRCEALGYRVAAIVTTGEEALDVAEVIRPDLVLMDVRLSGNIDGVEAARRMHEELDLPVVYVTAYSDDATLARAKRTGPFGYLLKPVGARDLHTTIEMALYRYAAEQELRESHALSRAQLEASPDPVALTDVQGRILSCNQRYVDLLGFSSESEAIGTSFLEALSTQDLRRWTKSLPRAVDRGFLEADEFTFTCAGGRLIRQRVTVSVMKDRRGTPRFLLLSMRNPNGSRRRGTNQQRARREEAALMKQVHQRIEKNLSLVTSVLQLHSRRIYDPSTQQLLRGCGSRMEALSLAQRLLSNEAHPGVLDLRDYVESLGSMLFDAHAMSPDGIAFNFQIDGIHLAADKAMPCCLIVHDLITNALQHAFAGRSAGAVTVSAYRNNGSSVAVSVGDNGIGIPSARKLETNGKIGFELIRMLTEQLHGSLERANGEGTSFTLTFPV